jgi:hypothetical protein
MDHPKPHPGNAPFNQKKETLTKKNDKGRRVAKPVGRRLKHQPDTVYE